MQRNVDLMRALWQSGKKQYDLALIVGVSESKLSKYLHGRATLTRDQAARLTTAIAYECPVRLSAPVPSVVGCKASYT